MLPRRQISPEERQAQQLSPDTEAFLDEALQEQGCALLEGLFPQELIARCAEEFRRGYSRFFAPGALDAHFDGVQRVGMGRWMTTLKIRGAFRDPQLYASPLLFPWITSVLGDERILSSFGAVVALPGAKDQHKHRDLPPLFEEPALQELLPCYALTLLVPLLESNPTHGTTQLVPGSHRRVDEAYEEGDFAVPTVPLGGCLLMDYRLYHGGTANVSGQVRPLLYQVYARPWFRDHRNFKKQAPLWITRKALGQVPKHHKPLFAHARISWW